MPKLALCIDRAEAPQSVLAAFAAHTISLVPIDETNFFHTPVQLVDRAICDNVKPEGLEVALSKLQLLPYLVLRKPSGDVFSYVRGSAGDESRLHAKISIGAGGHVDTMPDAEAMEEDPHGTLLQHLRMEAAREGLEEVGIVMDLERINFSHFLIGNTEVDHVHLGLLCIYDVPEDQNIEPEAGTLLDSKFTSVHVLSGSDNYDRLENWSKAALTAL